VPSLTADVLRCVEAVCDPNLNLGWRVGDEKDLERTKRKELLLEEKLRCEVISFDKSRWRRAIVVVVATNLRGEDETKTGRAGAGHTELAEPGESRARARR